jgi:hypothetical protein
MNILMALCTNFKAVRFNLRRTKRNIYSGEGGISSLILILFQDSVTLHVHEISTRGRSSNSVI